MSSYAIGVDSGTESGRALILDLADGRAICLRKTLRTVGAVAKGEGA